jgi:hypothetical protein
VSSFPVACISSVDLIGFDIESTPNYETGLPQLPYVPLNSTLELYLSDGLQTWSLCHLSEQLDTHNTALAKLRHMFAQLEEVLHLSDEQSTSPGLCCHANQFLLDSYSTIDNEQEDESPEAVALEDLLGLAVKLAESHVKHGQFASQTLMQEFELAKAVERNGYQEEAEYHCTRILGRCPQIDVESFLGMILAKASRLEESTFCLFRAITSFIIHFGDYSLQANARLFAPIESLFAELIHLSEQDTASLTSCMTQMMYTMLRANSEGTTLQIHPQLFIHGFSFAHECSVLGLTDSAKSMYRYLLEHSALHLDAILHAKEKATAHERYGILLREEEEWMSSAEELLSACKCVMKSGTHDGRFNKFLERDYVELLPYLASESNEEDSLARKIREALNCIQRQVSSHLRSTSGTVQASRLEEYFSSDLPINLATPEPSAITHVGQFGFSSTATDPVQGDLDLTSTESLSASISYKYGLTYSLSEITGISDSIFMAA